MAATVGPVIDREKERHIFAICMGAGDAHVYRVK